MNDLGEMPKKILYSYYIITFLPVEKIYGNKVGFMVRFAHRF